VTHEHDRDDTIATTRLVYVADGGDPAPEWANELGRRILKLLKREREPLTANRLATALNRSAGDVGLQLVALMNAGHVLGSKSVLGGREREMFTLTSTRRKHPTRAPDEVGCSAPDELGAS
jgi:hypothetical protein